MRDRWRRRGVSGMRLAFIYEGQVLSNSTYRSTAPMSALRRRGHEIAWEGALADPQEIGEFLRDCDLVHVYRKGSPLLLRELRGLQQRGVAISWDNDDNVMLLPKAAPNYKSMGGLIGARDFAMQTRALRMADLVTTTSEPLAAVYRQAGAANVGVIENYLPGQSLRGRRPKHDGVVIGWTAAAEHVSDRKKLRIDEVLLRILEAHEHVRVITIGVGLGLQHPRYEHVPRVEFHELVPFLRRIDIGIAPLADIPFNRARSNVKVKEYSAAGATWLASPVQPYLALGASEGGRLVADDEWYDALDSLIRHPVERKRMQVRARTWATDQSIHCNAHQWEEMFQDAITRARRRAGLDVQDARSPSQPSSVIRTLGRRARLGGVGDSLSGAALQSKTKVQPERRGLSGKEGSDATHRSLG